jgi:hypothetical protein
MISCLHLTYLRIAFSNLNFKTDIKWRIWKGRRKIHEQEVEDEKQANSHVRVTVNRIWNNCLPFRKHSSYQPYDE